MSALSDLLIKPTEVPGLTADDQWMVDDAFAAATAAAPCLNPLNLSEGQRAAARGIMRRALMRWKDAGSGARTTVSDSRGPLSHSETIDTRPQFSSGGIFWRSEKAELRSICQASGSTPRAAMGWSL